MAASAESAWPLMNKIAWTRLPGGPQHALGATNLLAGDLNVDSLSGRPDLGPVLRRDLLLGPSALRSPSWPSRSPSSPPISFAAPIMAFTATQKTDQPFNMLFRSASRLSSCSAALLPIDNLPLFVRPLAWFTPLYHGVSLARSFSLGQVDPVADLISRGVLCGFVAAGLVAARITFRRRLESDARAAPVRPAALTRPTRMVRAQPARLPADLQWSSSPASSSAVLPVLEWEFGVGAARGRGPAGERQAASRCCVVAPALLASRR